MQRLVVDTFAKKKAVASAAVKKKQVTTLQQMRPGRRYKMQQHRMNPSEYGSMRGKRNALKRERQKLREDVANLLKSLQHVEATTLNEAQRINDNTKRLLPQQKKLEQVEIFMESVRV